MQVTMLFFVSNLGELLLVSYGFIQDLCIEYVKTCKHDVCHP